MVIFLILFYLFCAYDYQELVYLNNIKKLELLSPAKDLECGIAAINCGADAVYIGAPRFGARSAAGNPVENIEKLANYAHKFNSRVYVTLNTILYDNELDEAREMAFKLYDAGADALIIQDMGLLEMDLSPIPLFASTQTHNYSVERIKFLENAGIKRIILARELSLEQIREISRKVKAELEFFVHGALCVSYSGQCYMSHAISSRSANRGECMQACRMLYSLEDSKGRTLIRDKYLLSLKDLNLSAHLGELIDAGITSFKIEGRLKDITYVKNVTAYYRKKIDDLTSPKSIVQSPRSIVQSPKSAKRPPLAWSGVAKSDNQESTLENAASLPTEWSGLVPCPSSSSSGRVEPGFSPDLNKTFNRGYTEYFLNGRTGSMASFNTQKSTGEYIGKVRSVGKDFFIIDGKAQLENGDGICFLDKENVLQGMNVNRAEGNRIFIREVKGLFPGAEIYRNYGHSFSMELKRDNSRRQIAVSFEIEFRDSKFMIRAADEDGFTAEEEYVSAMEPADDPVKMTEIIKKQLGKTGETDFYMNSFQVSPASGSVMFIPVSRLNELRRSILQKLADERIKNYVREDRLSTEKGCGSEPGVSGEEVQHSGNEFRSPAETLDYRANVVNRLSRSFYEKHGAKVVESGFELLKDYEGKVIMTCRYCIKKETGICPKDKKNEGMDHIKASGENIKTGSDNVKESLGEFTEPLYLRDRKRKYKLRFNCARCEMEIIYIRDL